MGFNSSINSWRKAAEVIMVADLLLPLVMD